MKTSQSGAKSQTAGPANLETKDFVASPGTRSEPSPVEDRPGASDLPNASRRAQSGYVYHRLLGFSDLAAVLLAAVLAETAASLSGHSPDRAAFYTSLVIMAPLWFVVAYLAGLYHQLDRNINQDFVDEIGLVAVAVTAWSWGFAVLQTVFSGGVSQITAPVFTWLLMFVFLMAFRGLVRHFARNRHLNRRPVAVIGDSFGLSALADRMDRHPEWSLDVRSEIVMDVSGGFIPQSRPPGGQPSDPGGTGCESFGNTELVAHLLERDVDRAIITGNSGGFSMHSELVRKLVENGIVVDFVAGGPETVYPSTSLHHLEGMTVMSTRPSLQQPFALALKRLLDVGVSAVLLLLSAPVLILAAIAIRLDSPGPVLFRQPRGGRNGETFDVIKLRTMEMGADSRREELRSERRIAEGEMLKLDGDPRITRAGRKLRRWSIDEIPQLWNVLTGDMSLVGPRPLPLDETAFVTPEFKARRRMRPGITGPWQVMGRSDIPMQDMLKLDYTYVVGWSFLEDLKLLLRTTTAVARHKGAR